MSKVLQKYAKTRPRDEDEDDGEYVQIEEELSNNKKANKKMKAAASVTALVAAAKKTTDLKPSTEAMALNAATKALTKGGKRNAGSNGKDESAIIYLGHIPNGFYEQEMRKFFSQFGTVKRIRLFRSRKTGNSKGYAFIEFASADAAKTVAETMNGYFLMERKLVAEVVPVERHHKMMFAKFRDNEDSESDKSDDSEGEDESVMKQAKALSNKQKKLAALGFEYEIPALKSKKRSISDIGIKSTEVLTSEPPKSAKKAKSDVAITVETKTPAKKATIATPATTPAPSTIAEASKTASKVVTTKTPAKTPSKTPAKEVVPEVDSEEDEEPVKQTSSASSSSAKTPAKTPSKTPAKVVATTPAPLVTQAAPAPSAKTPAKTPAKMTAANTPAAIAPTSKTPSKTPVAKAPHAPKTQEKIQVEEPAPVATSKLDAKPSKIARFVTKKASK